MAGLEEFQRAILLTFDPGADPAQRREANASLDALKAAAEGWRFCFQAFVASEVPQVKFWCLQTLVTLVSELNGERYVALPEPQKAELRASLIAWVQARGNPRTTRRTPRSRFVSGRASLSSARTPCPPATTHAGSPALCPFGPPAHARAPPQGASARSCRHARLPTPPPLAASPPRLPSPPRLAAPARRRPSAPHAPRQTHAHALPPLLQVLLHVLLQVFLQVYLAKRGVLGRVACGVRTAATLTRPPRRAQAKGAMQTDEPPFIKNKFAQLVVG